MCTFPFPDDLKDSDRETRHHLMEAIFVTNVETDTDQRRPSLTRYTADHAA